MELITSPHWGDYELIDSGKREKLERFGRYILIRPEPQAVWQRSMPEGEWEKMSHARYERMKGKQIAAGEPERGNWKRKPGMADQWSISYHYGELNLTFRLGLTSFGHIGLFPEQAANWNFLYDQILEWRTGQKGAIRPRVLNLFAYTGAASLAACAAGAEVVHVDAVKPVITWAKENMQASGLDHIRWVVEDALSFVRREVKRGNRYQGILLDPPAYGRGPEGEKWVLGDSIDELTDLCSRLMDPGHGMFLFSLYSMGFSSLIAENLVKERFPAGATIGSGELFFPDSSGKRLPLGTFLRLVY